MTFSRHSLFRDVVLLLLRDNFHFVIQEDHLNFQKDYVYTIVKGMGIKLLDLNEVR